MTEAYNQSVKAINENLQILKRSGASYEHLLQRLNVSIDKLEQVYFYHNQQKTELIKEKQKQDLFLENLKKYTVEQNLKLKTSSDSVESFSNMSKLTLTNCNFKKLNEVKPADSIDKLFRFLFVNLYNEFEKDFDYNNFVKVALKSDLNDFQKRIALFSVVKLDSENRDKLNEIKNADYSLNKDNEDLCNLLAWLEYNYEAFLALKEKEQSMKMILDTKNKEKKYTSQAKSSKRILADLDEIIAYCDAHLTHLKLYKKKFEETNEIFKKTDNNGSLKSKMNALFAAVDNFQGNEILAELDQEMGNAVEVGKVR